MTQKVNLQLTGPAVATDGNAIRIDVKNGQASLIFFQVTEQSEEEVKASSVAHVRLSLQSLQRLARSIDNSIAKAQEKAKTKKQDKQ